MEFLPTRILLRLPAVITMGQCITTWRSRNFGVKINGCLSPALAVLRPLENILMSLASFFFFSLPFSRKEKDGLSRHKGTFYEPRIEVFSSFFVSLFLVVCYKKIKKTLKNKEEEEDLLGLLAIAVAHREFCFKPQDSSFLLYYSHTSV